jgi:hypothetical protein
VLALVHDQFRVRTRHDLTLLDTEAMYELLHLPAAARDPVTRRHDQLKLQELSKAPDGIKVDAEVLPEE